MLTPIIVGAVFAIGFCVACFVRPNAARVFLGIFFIAMGLGVNLGFVLTSPAAYVDYGSGALLPAYRWLTTEVIGINPTLFGALLLTFEVTMGVLLLGSGVRVKIGLIGTMIFIAALVPVSVMQIPWAGFLVGQAWLLTKEFDASLPAMVQARRAARAV